MRGPDYFRPALLLMPFDRWLPVSCPRWEMPCIISHVLLSCTRDMTVCCSLFGRLCCLAPLYYPRPLLHLASTAPRSIPLPSPSNAPPPSFVVTQPTAFKPPFSSSRLNRVFRPQSTVVQMPLRANMRCPRTTASN